jgi:hypothetical protein
VRVSKLGGAIKTTKKRLRITEMSECFQLRTVHSGDKKKNEKKRSKKTVKKRLVYIKEREKREKKRIKRIKKRRDGDD